MIITVKIGPIMTRADTKLIHRGQIRKKEHSNDIRLSGLKVQLLSVSVYSQDIS